MSRAVPQLRFPGFEGAWAPKTLGDFMTFKNGVNAEKDQYGSGTKFINVLDIIAAGPIYHDKIIGRVEVSARELEKNDVRYGDVLFQRSSETREEVGQSNIYLDAEKAATFGGFVIRGRATQDFDPRFFDGLLKTDTVRSDMTSRSGGSTRFNIGQDALAMVAVAVPSEIAEQQKIADLLGTVDAKLDALRRKKSGLEAFKSGLMQRLFSQEIRFSQDEGTDFPDWEEKTLGDILTVCYGKDHKAIADGNIPVYGTGGIMRHVNRALSHGPSILIGRKGTIDRPRLVDGPFWTVDTLFYTRLSETVNPRLAFALVEQVRWAELNEATGVPSLTATAISKVKIVLPAHPDEQRKIADALSAMDAKIAAVAGQITHMETFKKGLLQQMFL